MDPYEFAQRQGQTIGSRGQPADEPFEAADLMDMLDFAFNKAGHGAMLTPDGQVAVAKFAQFCNTYLATHRVVSTGMVNGEFSLVFESGEAVPLASRESALVRPDSVVPITSPISSKMHGMPVVDNSIPVTTGQAGSPVRRPK